MKKALLLCSLLAAFCACACVEAAEGGKALSDFGAFSVKDGRIFRDGTELDCEVHEIPEGIDNGIASWGAVGPDVSDAVKEEETGVLFFGPAGAVVGCIPLDSASEVQGLAWNPDGGRLVLITGGFRPDVFFTAYGEGMEKGTELAGLNGSIEWVDPHRFVYTRIDDVREGAVSPGRSYGFKFSVVLYDTTAGAETVLKGSTDTQNYTLLSVSGDEVKITENYVKSVKDWADEDKVQEKEMTVPIPAAG